MSRYIDADALIKRWDEMSVRGRTEFDQEIMVAPSIDICFCRECKHNYNKVLNHGKMKPRCDFTDRVLTENDFCSRGEREDE